MKKFLPFLSLALIIALVMTACKSSPTTTDSQAAEALQQQAKYNSDTAGLAQFQAWKVQNELANVQDYNKPVQQAAEAPTAPAKAVRKSSYHAPVHKMSKPAPAPVSSTNTSTSNSSSDNSTVSNDNTGTTASSESAGTAKAPEKKGISKAAKGAVIGGVVGAVGGAVVNKSNRVVGAVIGGVIGAGGGYAIGRGMDKKDGRIDLAIQ